MEGCSAAASVLTVLKVSWQVVQLCQSYYDVAKDAREDIKLLRNEVMSLRDVLINLQNPADSPDSANPSILGLLNQPGGIVEQCLSELERLYQKLERGPGKHKIEGFALSTLKWPFVSRDVGKSIEVVGRYNAIFSLALAGDQRYIDLVIFRHLPLSRGPSVVMAGSFRILVFSPVPSDIDLKRRDLAMHINKSVTELRQEYATTQIDVAAIRTGVAATQADISARQMDEYRRRIIQWLSTVDPSSNHNAAWKKHQPTTGEWLIKRPDFEEWEKTGGLLLLLCGIR
jgi:hypothetical protein